MDPGSYIGTHAENDGLTPITRDARRFETCFAAVTLVAPNA